MNGEVHLSATMGKPLSEGGKKLDGKLIRRQSALRVESRKKITDDNRYGV